MIPDPTDPTRTVTVPAFMTEAQFRDPAYCAFSDLGVICTLFVPALAIGGFWLPEPRLWMLQSPCRTLEEHLNHVKRYLAATDQLSAAQRFCQAVENLPASLLH